MPKVLLDQNGTCRRPSVPGSVRFWTGLRLSIEWDGPLFQMASCSLLLSKRNLMSS
jgi:hypothetical protein